MAACVCVLASRQCVMPRSPASTDSYSFGLHATGSRAVCYKRRPGSLPGNHCNKLPNLQPMHTHVFTADFFSQCNGHTRKRFTLRRPPLHEYSFATVMSCDMLPWQGCGTTCPGCGREGKAVSVRVTQACRVQPDPTFVVRFVRWIPDIPKELLCLFLHSLI